MALKRLIRSGSNGLSRISQQNILPIYIPSSTGHVIHCPHPNGTGSSPLSASLVSLQFLHALWLLWQQKGLECFLQHAHVSLGGHTVSMDTSICAQQQGQNTASSPVVERCYQTSLKTLYIVQNCCTTSQKDAS